MARIPTSDCLSTFDRRVFSLCSFIAFINGASRFGIIIGLTMKDLADDEKQSNEL